MSYYQFKKQEILQKAMKNYSKEKNSEYYLLNKEAIKQKTKNSTKYDQNRKASRKRISKKLLRDIKGL